MIKYLLCLLLLLPLSVTCNEKNELIEDIYYHCQCKKYQLSNWWYECNDDEQYYKRILEAKIEVYVEIVQMIEKIYDNDDLWRYINNKYGNEE